MTPASIIARLRSDRRAVAGIIFAGSIFTIIVMTGLAIDFSGAVSAKTQMQGAIDAGLLTTVNKAVDLYKADPHTDFAAAVQAGTDRFNAQAGAITFSAVDSVAFQVTKTTNKYVATATSTGHYNTVIGNMVGVPVIPIGLNGAVTIYTAEYLDAHVLIDRSESMLVGGSDADRTAIADIVYSNKITSSGPTFPINQWQSSNPNANPPNGCYFACHFNATPYSSTSFDFYGASRLNNITLRLDQMETATAQMVTQMQAADNDVQYRFSAWSIAAAPNELRSEYALSTDLSGGLSLNIVPDLEGTGGAPDTSLTKGIADFGQNHLAVAGDGTSAAAPKQVIIIMSDGIDDVMAVGNEIGYKCCNRIQYALNSGNIEDDNGRTNACDILKRKGAIVAVIQTRNWDPTDGVSHEMVFDPITGNQQPYYTAVQDVANANMKACASSTSLYFPVDNTAEISAAMTTILQTALAIPARFTR